MTLRITILTFFALAFFNSCETDDVGDEISMIHVNYSVSPTADLTTLRFHFHGGNFNCANVQFDYTLDVTSNAIYVNIGKSSLNGPCISYGRDWHEANTFFNVSGLANGDYLLNFINKDIVMHSTMRIDDNEIVIGAVNNDKLAFGTTLSYFRIPKDAIWGTMDFYNESDAHLFTDSLIALGAAHYAPLLTDGNYSSFQISNGALSDFGYPVNENSKFLMKTSLDTAQLKDVMEYFCSSGQASHISATTGKGEYLQAN